MQAPRILNPVTRRPIVVGGTVFRRLTNPETGKFDFDEPTRTLIRRPTPPLIRVVRIRNPSDGEIEDRIHEEFPNTDRQTEALVATIEDGFIDDDLLIDPWYQANAYEVEIDFGDEIFRVFAAGEDGAIIPPSISNLLDAQVLTNNPIQLPYENVSLNDGPDDRCVERWLGFHIPNPTVRNIIDAVNGTPGLEVDIRDLFDKRIDCSDGILLPSSKRGIMFQEHIYPIRVNSKGTYALEMVKLPKFTYNREQLPYMHRRINDEHRLYYKNRDVFYLGESGAFHPEMNLNDEQRAFLNEMPRGIAWDPGMLQQFKKAAMPMYGYVEERKDFESDQAVAIDMVKCYYNIACRLADSRNPWCVFEPDMFLWAQAYNRDMQLGHLDWIVLPDDVMPTISRKLGIVSNLMCWALFDEVRKISGNIGLPHFEPRAVLRFHTKARWSEYAKKELKAWKGDNTKMKEFRDINGAMGRIHDIASTAFQIGYQFPRERDWYMDNHGFDDGGHMLTRRVEKMHLRNRFAFHLSVIQYANVAVMQTMRAIKRHLGIMPIKIKTDSLTYEKVHFTSACMLRACVPSVSTLEDLAMAGSGFEWKGEEAKPPKDPPRRTLFYDPLDVTHVFDDQYIQRNRCHYGPPGSGKTHHVLNRLDGEPKYDFIATMTNRNARRIGGITLHKLLGLGILSKNANVFFKKLRNTRIFIDEAQSIPRKIWSVLIMLFHDFNVSFTFAMDRNQLAPIDDGDRPINIIAFCGRTFPHTDEFRNDPDLVIARSQVLEKRFHPTVLVGRWNSTRHTTVNIAALRATCTYVNEHYTRQHGISWGGPGRYIVCLDNEGVEFRDEVTGLKRKKPKWLYQSSLYDINVNGGPLINVETGEQASETFAYLEKALGWAYCVTTDKMIGSTIDEPYTIWDADTPWFHTRWGLFYTAITRGRVLADITFRGSPPS